MLIEAKSLRKSYGGQRAIDGVTFSVPAPSIVGLIGANGAGKSTTLRILAGTLQADSGSAVIGGHDVAVDRIAAQRLVGYLPEAANGFAALTVGEFLTSLAELRATPRGGSEAAVRRVVELLDLGEARHRILGNLSKGWRQRAWLAQALIHDPPVLILDEPTDGLDPRQKVELRGLLKRLSGDCAILMSTHILEEAEELCDRIVVINEGEVVADEATAGLLDGTGRLAPAVLGLTAPGGGDVRGQSAS